MRTPEEIRKTLFSSEATGLVFTHADVDEAIRAAQRETIEACATEARKHYWIKDAVAAIRALAAGEAQHVEQ